MNYTDNELKQLLAKMLPETLAWFPFLMEGDSEQEPFLAWRIGDEVLDTELLHLCSLVEAGLTTTQHYQFRCNLWEETKAEKEGRFGGINGEEHNRRYASATWQQRTAALAEVKGVTP